MKGKVTIFCTFFQGFQHNHTMQQISGYKRNTSHVRPVLVSEKYSDTKSDLYFSRSGTVFLYFVIVIRFELEGGLPLTHNQWIWGCIFNICIVPYFWQDFKVDKQNSKEKLNFMHSWWFSAPKPSLILVVFLGVGGVAWILGSIFQTCIVLFFARF